MVRPRNEIWSQDRGRVKVSHVTITAKSVVIVASSRLQDHWGNVGSALEPFGNWMPALCHMMPGRSRRKQLPMTSPTFMLATVPLRSHTIRLDQVLLLASVVSLQQAQQGLGAFSPSGNTVVVLDDSTRGGQQHSSFFSNGRQHFDFFKAGEIRPCYASHSHTVQQCF